MVAIDASVLLLLLNPGAKAARDDAGREVKYAAERVKYLVEKLEAARSPLIVPTPALAEVLVRTSADAANDIVAKMLKFGAFRIEPFDTRAALEVAVMSRESRPRRSRVASDEQTHAKLKYDRQILAIAKVHGVSEIYADDRGIRALGPRLGVRVISVSEMDLPPHRAQGELGLGAAEAGSGE